MAIFRMRSGLRKSDPNPQQAVAQRQVRCPLASTPEDDELLLEQQIFGDHRPHATGTADLRVTTIRCSRVSKRFLTRVSA
jgi:hypothetical protein